MNYYNKKTSMENQIKPEAYLKAMHSKSAGFPIEAKIFYLVITETMGFEPMCHCWQPDFESGSLQPLRYVSLSMKSP